MFSLKQRLLTSSFLALIAPAALAASPTQDMTKTSTGIGGISTVGNVTTVLQNSGSANIYWKSIDTTKAQSLNFVQPNSSSVAINRVTSGQATNFAGQLNANGKVVIMNDAGVTFAAGSQVNVGALVATTAKTSSVDSSGKLNLTDLSASAVNFNGTVNAPSGYVTGIAKEVTVAKTGTINADNGNVNLMANAKTYSVDLTGNGKVNYTVDPLTSGKVSVLGNVNAHSGDVLIQASASAIANGSVNLSGVVDVSNLSGGGAGSINMASSGTTTITGNLLAQNGGDIKVSAGNLAVNGVVAQGTGKIDASGGSITLTSGGTTSLANTTIAGDDVNLDSVKALTITGQTAVSGGNVDMKTAAALSVAGNLTSSAQNLSIDAVGYTGGAARTGTVTANLTSTNGGSIYIGSDDAMTAGGGASKYDAGTGKIKLASDTSLGLSSVTLSGNEVDVAGGNGAVTIASTVKSSAGMFDISGDSIKMPATFTTTNSGGIGLHSKKTMTVGDVTTNGGSVSLSSDADLNLTKNVAGKDITVSAGGNIAKTVNGDISLNADGNIKITGNVVNNTAGNITVLAGHELDVTGNITTANGDIYMQSGAMNFGGLLASDMNIGSVNSKTPSVISAGGLGKVTLKSSGEINLANTNISGNDVIMQGQGYYDRGVWSNSILYGKVNATGANVNVTGANSVKINTDTTAKTGSAFNITSGAGGITLGYYGNPSFYNYVPSHDASLAGNYVLNSAGDIKGNRIFGNNITVNSDKTVDFLGLNTLGNINVAGSITSQGTSSFIAGKDINISGKSYKPAGLVEGSAVELTSGTNKINFDNAIIQSDNVTLNYTGDTVIGGKLNLGSKLNVSSNSNVIFNTELAPLFTGYKANFNVGKDLTLADINTAKGSFNINTGGALNLKGDLATHGLKVTTGKGIIADGGNHKISSDAKTMGDVTNTNGENFYLGNFEAGFDTDIKSVNGANINLDIANSAFIKAGKTNIDAGTGTITMKDGSSITAFHDLDLNLNGKGGTNKMENLQVVGNLNLNIGTGTLLVNNTFNVAKDLTVKGDTLNASSISSTGYNNIGNLYSTAKQVDVKFMPTGNIINGSGVVNINTDTTSYNAYGTLNTQYINPRTIDAGTGTVSITNTNNGVWNRSVEFDNVNFKGNTINLNNYSNTSYGMLIIGDHVVSNAANLNLNANGISLNQNFVPAGKVNFDFVNHNPALISRTTAVDGGQYVLNRNFDQGQTHYDVANPAWSPFTGEMKPYGAPLNSTPPLKAK